LKVCFSVCLSTVLLGSWIRSTDIPLLLSSLVLVQAH
jgi:hypothetical protein